MICVINSNVANIASVLFALERLGCEITLSRDPGVIQAASHVILPGVGHAQAAMQSLQEHGLVDIIRNLRQPTLGICLGMQLLFQQSEEGDVETLGLIPDAIKRFTNTDLIIPHMGWNQLKLQQSHPLTAGVSDGAYCYFVHSYFAPISQHTLASCDYGNHFSAIVQKDNFFGCQFHPERSGQVGQQILSNFIQLS